MATAVVYDEATIVRLWTDIYRLQEALCYYPRNSIIYPPSSGHRIDEVTCERQNLSQAVVSLMRKIPYPKDYEDLAYSYPFVNDSIAAVYTEAQCITIGRDSEGYMLGERIRKDLLKPSEVTLTFAKSNGVIVLLDTDENAIRWWAPNESPETQWPAGSPESEPGFFTREGEDWSHPHDYYPRPAAEVLQELIDKYRTLEWIPRSDDWARIVTEGCDEWLNAKRCLISDYGWPDNCDHDEFRSNLERFWWEVDPQNQFEPAVELA